MSNVVKPNYENEDKVEGKLKRFVDHCFDSLYENYKKKVMEVRNLSEEEYMKDEDKYKDEQSISRTESAHLFYELMKGHKYEEAWDDDEFRKLYKLFEEDEDPDKKVEEGDDQAAA
tara:strand:+ start:93 stop:440 length:348 start_codon:yes stop_codon:yes gene_type:complete